ncbi:hypothetical protein SK875_C00052 [Burkholderia contaminans]|jgi:hypothetical protein|nr:hypothetical protein SK875_C00052 [Burkholderia contaminans]
MSIGPGTGERPFDQQRQTIVAACPSECLYA